jgi:hypothetical protein
LFREVILEATNPMCQIAEVFGWHFGWPYSPSHATGDRQEYCSGRTLIKLSYKMKIIKEGNATVKVSG